MRDTLGVARRGFNIIIRAARLEKVTAFNPRFYIWPPRARNYVG
jgi:hypothetical protein